MTLRTLGTLTSLIPNSPTTSVFDHLQYESSEQGRPGRSRHLVAGSHTKMVPIEECEGLQGLELHTEMSIQVLVWTDQCIVSLVHILSVYHIQ